MFDVDSKKPELAALAKALFENVKVKLSKLSAFSPESTRYTQKPTFLSTPVIIPLNRSTSSTAVWSRERIAAYGSAA